MKYHRRKRKTWACYIVAQKKRRKNFKRKGGEKGERSACLNQTGEQGAGGLGVPITGLRGLAGGGGTQQRHSWKKKKIPPQNSALEGRRARRRDDDWARQVIGVGKSKSTETEGGLW